MTHVVGFFGFYIYGSSPIVLVVLVACILADFRNLLKQQFGVFLWEEKGAECWCRFMNVNLKRQEP